jgi:hypothetical protein
MRLRAGPTSGRGPLPAQPREGAVDRATGAALNLHGELLQDAGHRKALRKQDGRGCDPAHEHICATTPHKPAAGISTWESNSHPNMRTCRHEAVYPHLCRSPLDGAGGDRRRRDRRPGFGGGAAPRASTKRPRARGRSGDGWRGAEPIRVAASRPRRGGRTGSASPCCRSRTGVATATRPRTCRPGRDTTTRSPSFRLRWPGLSPVVDWHPPA